MDLENIITPFLNDCLNAAFEKMKTSQCLQSCNNT